MRLLLYINIVFLNLRRNNLIVYVEFTLVASGFISKDVLSLLFALVLVFWFSF